MKTMGVLRPISSKRFCKATPVMLGIRMSSKMTAGDSGSDCCKNTKGSL